MKDKKNIYTAISESSRKSLEIKEKLYDKTALMSEKQDKMQKILDATTVPTFDITTPVKDASRQIMESSAVGAFRENTASTKVFTETGNAMNILTGASSAISAFQNNSMVQAIGGITIKSVVPSYKFESSALRTFEELNNRNINNLAVGLKSFIANSAIREIQSVTSNLREWLQTVDFSPLTSILEDIQNIGFDYEYEEVNEVFLNAMFDAKWFPYAGWISDYGIVEELLRILDTSRATKNRIRRVDKLIFSYYDKEEINNFKRRWRRQNLPSYMKRILVQSVQAYHRREYALTVSALSTLWEGIIQEKVNDDSYRISRKIKENLAKLIEKNEFDKIFVSFCDEFIFYKCENAGQVKSDVPGRHCIAHCWYDTYPNRKMALNAILFTDFLLVLQPLEKTE